MTLEKIEKILNTVDLRIHEEADYEDILKEFKANIKEWALELLPNELSYSKDGFFGEVSAELVEAFNTALMEVKDAIEEETK